MKLINLTLASFLLVAPAMAADMTDDFESIDANGDGVITPSEMATAQRASLDTQNDGIMNLLDKDDNGIVSHEEYMGFYGKLATGDKELEQVKAQFNNLDKDESGDISAEELGSFRAGSLDQENDEFFKAVDTDKNGEITKTEFNAFVQGMKGLFDAVGSDYLK